MAAFTQRGDDTEIDVYVQPRASRDQVVGLHGGAMKVKIAAPPVDGAANKALVAFVAKQLGIPRRRVEIVAGASSRTKRLRILQLTAQEARRALLGDQ